MIVIKQNQQWKKYADSVETRLSPRHRLRMQRDIVARVIHAEITFNFMVEALRRPRHWDELSPTYKKIKQTTTHEKAGNRQPAELGKYPTPWGNIGVKTGRLYGSLGTILRITANQVVYGTDVPYAEDFATGQKGLKSMHVAYVSKKGKDVRYNKKFRKRVAIPGRPFDYVSMKARQAISTAMMEYVTVPLGRNRIMIPPISQNILASGGRYVYISHSG